MAFYWLLAGSALACENAKRGAKGADRANDRGRPIRNSGPAPGSGGVSLA
jgi:hypothetical protein